MFLVMQGGVDVGKATGIIAQHPDADGECLERLLIAAGLTKLDARRVILLAPIAFGRRLLADLG